MLQATSANDDDAPATRLAFSPHSGFLLPGHCVSLQVPATAHTITLLSGRATEPSTGLGRCRRAGPHGQRGGSWPSSRCGSGGRCGNRVGCGPAGGDAPPLPSSCGGRGGVPPSPCFRPARRAGVPILAITITIPSPDYGLHPTCGDSGPKSQKSERTSNPLPLAPGSAGSARPNTVGRPPARPATHSACPHRTKARARVSGTVPASTNPARLK